MTHICTRKHIFILYIHYLFIIYSVKNSLFCPMFRVCKIGDPHQESGRRFLCGTTPLRTPAGDDLYRQQTWFTVILNMNSCFNGCFLSVVSTYFNRQTTFGENFRLECRKLCRWRRSILCQRPRHLQDHMHTLSSNSAEKNIWDWGQLDASTKWRVPQALLNITG